MTVHHQQFRVQNQQHKEAFHDVTEAVKGAVVKSGVKNGIAVVYSQHTTCSVIIQEEAHDATLDGTKFILRPTMILAEPPDLIGTGRAVGSAYRDFIPNAVAGVKRINPGIIVFSSAGIKTPDDVAAVIRAGAEATGSTSGILKAPDPVRMMEEMVRALKETWLELHGYTVLIGVGVAIRYRDRLRLGRTAAG